MYGYHGKVLHVDLSQKKFWAEEKPEDWYKMWIGGVSMATRLCWENINPGAIHFLQITQFALPTEYFLAHLYRLVENLVWLRNLR